MRMRTGRCTAAALLLAAVGCTESPDTREFSFFAFGTLVELTVVDADEGAADEARALAAERLDQWHHQWHAWQPGPLTELNQALAEGEPAPVPEPLAELITRGQALSRASGGLFEPAIGRLIGLWGFHADAPPAGPPPPEEAVADLVRRRPTMDDLVFEGGLVRSGNAAAQLDFGAFAKGIALSRLSDAIRDLGIRNFLINAGGDLVAAGRHGERAWRVGIRQPHGAGVLGSIEPRDGEAVFTSGDYERFYVWDGVRYHHIIDPRSGFPARGVRSVTVIHEDAALADAAATALFVAGPENWPGVAGRMGVDQVMLVDAEGTLHMTPAMEKRVKLEAEPRPALRIQTP